MNIDLAPIQVNVERSRPVIDAALRNDGTFRGTLDAETAAKPADDPSGSRARAREAAEQFVSSAFVLPVFKMMEESMLEMEGPFAPGLAEERFMPMLHEKFADEIVKASGFGLVDAVVDRLVGAQSPDTTGKGAVNVIA